MINQAIITHIMNVFGVPNANNKSTLLSNKFLLNKKLSIELDTGEIINKNVWGSSVVVGTSVLKLMTAELTIDPEENEYVLLLQLDNFPVYALHSQTPTSEPKSYYAVDQNNWIELNTLLLAKLLSGVEQLNELFFQQDKLNDFQDLYQKLVSVINYEEAIEKSHQT